MTSLILHAIFVTMPWLMDLSQSKSGFVYPNVLHRKRNVVEHALRCRMCLADLVETSNPRLLTDNTTQCRATVRAEVVLAIAAGAEVGAAPWWRWIRLSKGHQVAYDAVNISTLYRRRQRTASTHWIQYVLEC